MNREELAYISIRTTSTVPFLTEWCLHTQVAGRRRKHESKRTRSGNVERNRERERGQVKREERKSEATELAVGEAKLILCKACVRSGIYGGRFATDCYYTTARYTTLEPLFARIRSPRERRGGNPGSAHRSASPPGNGK